MLRFLSCLSAIFLFAGPIPASSADTVATADGLRLEWSDKGTVFTGLACGDTSWDIVPEKTGFFIKDLHGEKAYSPLLCRAALRNSRLVLEGTQQAVGVKLTAEAHAQGPYIHLRGSLHNMNVEEDRALILKFCIGMAESDLVWADALLNRERIEQGKRYGNALIPIAAVSGKKGGVTMAIPHDSPARFRTEFADRQMAMRWNFGLTRQTTKFPNRADFALVLYRHDPQWGFRDALRKYYEMTPANYAQSTPRAGLWSFLMGTPFDKYPNDFAFHEAGTGELSLVIPWELTPRVREMMLLPEKRPPKIDFDHPFGWMKAQSAREFAFFNDFETTQKHGIYFFPYLILWQRQIYSLPGYTLPDDYDYQMKLFEAWNVEDVLKYESPFFATSFSSVEELKQIIRTSGLHRPDGKLFIRYRRNTGNTLTFAVNPDPDLFHDRNVRTMGKYALVYMEMFERELPETNGFYIDGLQGLPNYRTEHFRYADCPLTFDAEGRVVLSTLFSMYEWVVEATRRLHARGRWLMCNGTTPGHFFHAAYLDVGGTEAPPAKWDHYAWCRCALGKKPVAALERYNQHDDYIEDALKRATVFNVFYGFDPNFYIMKHLRYKTKSLHERYVPVWQKLYKAGWEPVTLARTNAEGIMLERYGSAGRDRFFVVYNNTDSEQSFTMSFERHADLGPVGQVRDVMDADFSASARDTDEHYTLNLTLSPKQLRVLRIP